MLDNIVTNNLNNNQDKQYNNLVENNNNINIDNINEDSMIIELNEFKEDKLINYKFEIPLKYQMSKNVKVVGENVKNDGKIVKYYENSVVDVISKNNITRVNIYI
jgi:hypothetical protein